MSQKRIIDAVAAAEIRTDCTTPFLGARRIFFTEVARILIMKKWKKLARRDWCFHPALLLAVIVMFNIPTPTLHLEHIHEKPVPEMAIKTSQSFDDEWWSAVL